MAKYLQGKFEPKAPHKYVGDVTNIQFRSSWELKAFIWCDTTDAVLKWNSEELVIPYISPVDNRPHRYFVDLVIQIKDKSGKEQFYVVEIKPKKQTELPKVPNRVSQRYIKEIETYSVNQAKWLAAIEWCDKNNMKFQILTEKELGV